MDGNWIYFEDDWFNLNDFCHIWIEKCNVRLENLVTGNNLLPAESYYLMGIWRHNGEEVIISQNWHSLNELRSYLNRKLSLVEYEKTS